MKIYKTNNQSLSVSQNLYLQFMKLLTKKNIGAMTCQTMKFQKVAMNFQ